MESIASIAQTAVKAVWGDGTENEEPVSGVQGDVSKGEPFDGGNIEDKEPNATKSKSDTETQEESKTNDNGKTQTKGTNEPASAKEASRDRSKVEDGPAERESTQGVMGDGPKPLATIAKENGGDAGNMKSDSASKSSASSDDAKGGDINQPDRKEKKGTGEMYVKASGLAADGGDFDATKPGAGREADRLMEEKGIEKQSHDHPKPDTSVPGSGSGTKHDKDKPSMKERIKDKLHLHMS